MADHGCIVLAPPDADGDLLHGLRITAVVTEANPECMRTARRSVPDVEARVVSWPNHGLLDKLAAGPGDALVVATDEVISDLYAGLLGADVQPGVLMHDAGAVGILERRDGRARLVAANVLRRDPLRTAAPDGVRRVYVIRHGQATNVGDDGVLRATRDARLTARGREQADVLSRFITPLRTGALYVSDTPRAIETAGRLAGGRSLIRCAGLREIELGEYEGRDADAILAARPGFMTDPDVALPGGETPRELARRSREEVEGILARDPSPDVVCVAHGGSVRTLVAELTGMPLEAGLRLRTDWAGVTLLERIDGSWKVRVLNWSAEGAAAVASLPPLAHRDDVHHRLLGR
jgi:broad specificity phosphatase PhoE